jgi:hypothetical protein
MRSLIDAIEVYMEMVELRELGLTEEEVAGYIDFFFRFTEVEYIN